MGEARCRASCIPRASTRRFWIRFSQKAGGDPVLAKCSGDHSLFIDSAKRGRGERLQDAQHPELFSGLIWSGEQALELGLVDGLGSTAYVAREVVGEPEIVDFTVKESPKSTR